MADEKTDHVLNIESVNKERVLEEAARSGNAQALQDVLDKILPASYEEPVKQRKRRSTFGKIVNFAQDLIESKILSSDAAYTKLPKDIWIEIMKYLRIKDLLMISEVSKQFYYFASLDDLWKSHYYSIAWPGHLTSHPTESFKSMYCTIWKTCCYDTLKLGKINWMEWRNPGPSLNPKTNYDFLLKLLLIGDTGVGKSNIMFRFAEEIFTENYVSTIGVDFKILLVGYQQKAVKLQIWDTPSYTSTRFRAPSTAYYRAAHGILIVFDLTDRVSWENVKNWKGEVDRYSSHTGKYIIVGNKLDKQKERTVFPEEIHEFVSNNGAMYGEVSAKTGQNIDMVFAALVKEVVTNMPAWPKVEEAPKKTSKIRKTCSVM